MNRNNSASYEKTMGFNVSTGLRNMTKFFIKQNGKTEVKDTLPLDVLKVTNTKEGKQKILAEISTQLEAVLDMRNKDSLTYKSNKKLVKTQLNVNDLNKALLMCKFELLAQIRNAGMSPEDECVKQIVEKFCEDIWNKRSPFVRKHKNIYSKKAAFARFHVPSNFAVGRENSIIDVLYDAFSEGSKIDKLYETFCEKHLEPLYLNARIELFKPRFVELGNATNTHIDGLVEQLSASLSEKKKTKLKAAIEKFAKKLFKDRFYYINDAEFNEYKDKITKFADKQLADGVFTRIFKKIAGLLTKKPNVAKQVEDVKMDNDTTIETPLLKQPQQSEQSVKMLSSQVSESNVSEYSNELPSGHYINDQIPGAMRDEQSVITSSSQVPENNVPEYDTELTPSGYYAKESIPGFTMESPNTTSNPYYNSAEEALNADVTKGFKVSPTNLNDNKGNLTSNGFKVQYKSKGINIIEIDQTQTQRPINIQTVPVSAKAPLDKALRVTNTNTKKNF